MITGDDHVDLRQALEELNINYGINTVRVDSGGTLNGVLLRAGLVNEISVLIYPEMVGGTSPSSLFRAPDLTAPDGTLRLKLLDIEKMEGGVAWLHYEVIH